MISNFYLLNIAGFVTSLMMIMMMVIDLIMMMTVMTMMIKCTLHTIYKSSVLCVGVKQKCFQSVAEFLKVVSNM